MAPVESDYESWLLEQGGIVFEREARGLNSGDLQNLIVCLWWLDYGMRNAGDSDTVLLDAYPLCASPPLSTCRLPPRCCVSPATISNALISTTLCPCAPNSSAPWSSIHSFPRQLRRLVPRRDLGRVVAQMRVAARPGQFHLPFAFGRSIRCGFGAISA